MPQYPLGVFVIHGHYDVEFKRPSTATLFYERRVAAEGTRSSELELQEPVSEDSGVEHVFRRKRATVKARNVKTRQKSALFGSSEKAAKDRRGLSAFSTSRSCDSSCRVGAEAMLFEEHLRTSQLAFSLRQNTWRQARLCSISRVTVRSFAHEHRPAG